MKQILVLTVGMPLMRAFGAAHLSQVLEQTGLEKADIDALNALPDDTKDFKPDDYVSKVSAGYETRLLNDGKFLDKIPAEKIPEPIRKSIEAGQYGRFMNEFKSLAKNKGIDFSDLSEDEQKSLNKFGEKIFAKYEGKLGSPEAVTKLQNDLQKALQEKTALETDYPTKLKEVETTTAAKYQAQMTKLIATNELAGLKGLKVKPSFVVDSIMSNINSKYTVVTEGTEIKLMQKANPTLDAIDGKGNKITFAAALQEIAKEGDLLDDKSQEDIDESTGKRRIKVEINGDEIGIPKNIQDKINKNLALEGKK